MKLINTKKHDKFVSSPMFGKSTKLVPGIGEAYSQKLTEYNIYQASQLLELYINCKRDQTMFTHIMQQLTGGNPYHLNQTFYALDQFYKLNGEDP